MPNHAVQLPPGFRFHPTDEELIVHYLRNRLPAPPPSPVSIIADVDIYKFDPWDLPEKAVFGDREWYFFSPRDRKYPNGIRPNRTAVSGYWKASGTDKPISSGGHNVGVKKALVFYKGRPKGIKSNWIMHEYRLAEVQNNSYRPKRLGDHSMRLDDWVLCRIYKKSGHLPQLMMNEEHEGRSCKDYTCFPALQNLAQLNLPKASSISEILEEYSPLSDLFVNRQEPSRFDYNPHIGRPNSILEHRMGQSSECNGNGYPRPHVSQVESPVSVVGKLQSPDERSKNESAGGCLYPSREEDDSIMTSQSLFSQFDSSQSPPFCNEFMSYITFA